MSNVLKVIFFISVIMIGGSILYNYTGFSALSFIKRSLIEYYHALLSIFLWELFRHEQYKNWLK